MTQRYFSALLPTAGAMVSLDDHESHHAFHVMRVREGDQITLFDGKGNEATATVETAAKRQVICRTEGAVLVNRENEVQLTLGIAMPKGDRAKDLVERLTELGVNQLVPIHCQRTQWAVTENSIAKWQRIMIDACKQSGRNQLMQIASPVYFRDWLASDTMPTSCTRYLAHPPTESKTVVPNCSFNETRTVVPNCSGKAQFAIAIGPEGGFNVDEVTLAESQGWQSLSLGNRIYRIETAAIIAAIKIAGL